MRVLRCSDSEVAAGDLVFEEFEGEEVPSYAILSHTWDKDEVLFSHVQAGTAQTRQGYAKVAAAMTQANKMDLKYMWIDTCCIDKSSSAELSEAINSMFSWYQNAAVCLVHLADVYLGPDDWVDSESVGRCRWFTRGWCLQELVAPSSVVFFDTNWVCIGTKQSHAVEISGYTGISVQVLEMSRPVHSFSVAHRMSWAAKRKTTRPEDLAYCLMGIFEVNMPLLYGEGTKAFQRLQEQILRVSDDESIFAWTDASMRDFDEHGLLADSPANFVGSAGIAPYRQWNNKSSTQITNRGLEIDLPLVRVPREFIVVNRGGAYLAALNCLGLGADDERFVAIMLHKLPGDNNKEYKRIECRSLLLASERVQCESIFVRQTPAPAVKDLVCPLHYFRLHPPHVAKKLSILDMKFSDPGPAVSDHDDDAEWIPSRFRKVYKIHKQAGRLSAAILFKWLADDFRFVLVLGSSGHLEVGFDAFAWPAGDYLDSLEHFQKGTNTLRPEGETVYLDGTHELTVHTACSIRNDHKEYRVIMHVEKGQYTPIALSQVEGGPDVEGDTTPSNTSGLAKDQGPQRDRRAIYSYENTVLNRPIPSDVFRKLSGLDPVDEESAASELNTSSIVSPPPREDRPRRSNRKRVRRC